tara:strand:+ start:657 stop:851 length:195 start_codon:yes stop_codon:yes gene_type:complete
MTTQTKYYLMVKGLTLTSDLTPNNSGEISNIGYYTSQESLDIKLAASGSIGTLYTIKLIKEVVE